MLHRELVVVNLRLVQHGQGNVRIQLVGVQVCGTPVEVNCLGDSLVCILLVTDTVHCKMRLCLAVSVPECATCRQEGQTVIVYVVMRRGRDGVCSSVQRLGRAQ